MRPGATGARVHGDEFLMLTGGAQDGLPVALADRVLASLLEPPLEAGGETVTASMGVAVSSEGVQPEQLLHQADAAMYHAKRAGGARWKLFGSVLPSDSGRPRPGEQWMRPAPSDSEVPVLLTSPWSIPPSEGIPPGV